jgi:ribosomal protein L31E
MTDERTYTVPLRHGYVNAPRYYRTNKAVRTLRLFVARHMKVEEEFVRIGQHLNELLWQHGQKNPPPRVTITTRKLADGTVTAELAGKEYKASVKPKAKSEEPQTLKERLQDVVGKKEEKGDAATEETEQPVEKKEHKKEEAAQKPAKKTQKKEQKSEK